MTSNEAFLSLYVDRSIWTGATLSRLIALDGIERGLTDLTVRWVDGVRSGRLVRVLLRILVKLARALDSGMARVLQKGRALARGLSELALGWGNELAWSWRFDSEFQWALGLGLLPGS